jgi:hypothetical protein
MTTENATIQELRRQFAETAGQNFLRQMLAFKKLWSHPDLEWNDLLDALNRPEFLAHDAVLRLHQRLQIRVDKNNINVDRGFWEAILKERGINPGDKCGAFSQ